MLSTQFWHGFEIGVEISLGALMVVGLMIAAFTKRSSAK